MKATSKKEPKTPQYDYMFVSNLGIQSMFKNNKRK